MIQNIQLTYYRWITNRMDMIIVPAIDYRDGFDGYGSQTFSGAAYASVFFNV